MTEDFEGTRTTQEAGRSNWNLQPGIVISREPAIPLDRRCKKLGASTILVVLKRELEDDIALKHPLLHH